MARDVTQDDNCLVSAPPRKERTRHVACRQCREGFRQRATAGGDLRTVGTAQRSGGVHTQGVSSRMDTV
jgi:hypothetical protein